VILCIERAYSNISQDWSDSQDGIVGKPMHDISYFKRFFYRYLGAMYWLIHWTETHKILGLRLSSTIRFFTLLLPVLAWIRQLGNVALIFTLLLFIWIQFSYWRARRTGYYRFVASNTELLAKEHITPLSANKHIPVCATGIFSLKDWESNVVFKPAEYWQVPLGDHAIMVQHQPGYYLYQFISPNLLQNLRKGWLLFGSRPNPAISITFLSTWGPEFSDQDFSLLGKNDNKPIEKIRTIYLSFDNEEFEQAVWQNLIFDARRVRSEGMGSS
jgi:hypothetical protein